MVIYNETLRERKRQLLKVVKLIHFTLFWRWRGYKICPKCGGLRKAA